MTIWRYGDDVNTDQLFPGKYTYTCSTPEEIKPHLLEDLDPDFADGVEECDIILAGHNFGCGSSREQPVVGLKAVGIRAIVAKSFARIFYRAGLNQGLILVECPAAVEAYEPGDDVHVDVKKGVVSVAGESYGFPPLPDRILAIREAGGLLPYTRQLLKEEKKP
ncbi:MAG: 3-isopropylmalate dehydratase [Thermoplasmatota archaeon]